MDEQQASPSDATPTRSRTVRTLMPVVILLAAVVVGYLAVSLIGSVDWSRVGSALADIEPWQLAVLVLLLLIRQVLNAVPLALFVPGLRLVRSVRNDVTANVMGTVAPPPGDVVIRIAMFRTWGINPVDGMAGVSLNTFVFYAARFLAPMIGIALLVGYEIERGQVVAAVASAIIAIAIVVALVLVLRGDGLAAMVGRTAALAVRRMKSSVDPAVWADAVVDFRVRMHSILKRGLAPSLLALLAMVITDGLMLLAAVRFMGVTLDDLSMSALLGVFLIAYPLTVMPLSGLGFLDASVLAAAAALAPPAHESAIVAALVAWRVFGILGPLTMGAVSMLLWKVGTAPTSS